MKRLPEYCLLILGVCIIVWLLLSDGCGSKPPKGIERDTVYVMGRPDTVILTDTVYSHIVQPKPYKVYVSDTVLICDSVRVYVNIDNTGKVTVRDSVRGELLSQEIQSIQDTVIITRTDTMKITETIPPKEYIQVSVGMSYQHELTPFLSIGKGRTQVIAGYGLTNKAVMFGIGYRLTK